MLGVDPFVIADVMLYNIEIAQTFSSANHIKQDLFFKSIFNSFEQAVNFTISNGILPDFKSRILAIQKEAVEQKWRNKYDFEEVLDKIDF